MSDPVASAKTNPVPPDPATAWLSRLAGKFVVIDGPDGSGKSTQLDRFVAECESHRVPLAKVRDPGGTRVGERIRDILLNRDHDDMGIRCEMLLYMASRAELVDEQVRPGLKAGKLVLGDRFVSSTLAYQGTAGGLTAREITAAAEAATGGLWPDITILLDVDTATANTRMTGSAPKGAKPDPTLSLFADRMEAKGDAFHARVRQGYLDQAAANPDRYLVIDATGTPEQVWSNLLAQLRAHTIAQ
ncbi:Thymidylate kinase [hydrothermal vent metagenome]|uniref:dTMP kinase n=1 Tax=hydrothermal vent metagenome TaxID=652676 RepID=A0A3B1DBJ5_9ZZZZ